MYPNNRIIKETLNPVTLSKIIEEEEKGQTKSSEERREKIKELIEGGEVSPTTKGLGETVTKLAEWVAKNMNKELYQLGISEIEELIKARDLPYDPEVIKIVAEEFAKRRTIH